MAETKPSNPKDRAASSKIDLSLFPSSARAYGALAMVEGDLKYGGYNWRDIGVAASVYYSACGRHMDKWFNGEEVDPDTHVPHLASALACIAIVIDSMEHENLNDDRPPKQKVDLYPKLQEIVDYLRESIPRQADRFREKE